MKTPEQCGHRWSWSCEITNGPEKQIMQIFHCGICQLYKLEISFDDGTQEIKYSKTDPKEDFILMGHEYREYFVLGRNK